MQEFFTPDDDDAPRSSGRNVTRLGASAPKMVPHSAEIERAVLGGLMLDSRSSVELVDRLKSTDFYLEAHQVVYKAISELLGQNRPCDFLTVSDHLRQSALLDEGQGGKVRLDYLGGLASEIYSAAYVREHAEIVRKYAVFRALISIGMETAELGYRPEGRTPAELLEEAEKKIFAIRQDEGKTRGGFLQIGSLMDAIEARLERAKAGISDTQGLPTGFTEFDKRTQGLHPGDLIIVAGRPSMGKTSFAMNIAEHVALDQQKPVAVFSMEMSPEQLAVRVLSSYGRIDQQKLRSGELDDADWDRVVSASNLIREAPLHIDDTGALSPLDLRARARRLAARHGGLALIVVDYIQLMQSPGSENRSNEIAEISRNLKGLAKELNLPIVALSQLNRGVENRDNKRPRMADLRESGGIEQDADVIVFIYRDEVYDKDTQDKGVAELIIAKQRNGPTGTVKTAFLGQYTRFDNLADSTYENY